MNCRICEGGQSGDSVSMLYTFEDLHKLCFPKQHRHDKLISLAFEAYANGYPKAGRMLAKIAERYYR
jgi:hypothetical protein